MVQLLATTSSVASSIAPAVASSVSSASAAAIPSSLSAKRRLSGYRSGLVMPYP